MRTGLNMGRSAIVVGVVALAASACGSTAPETAVPSASPASATVIPTPPTPFPELPQEPADQDDPTERRLLAGVNIAIAEVDLSEIIFDTFDGGSATLAEADEAQILALLNAIPPIDEPNYISGDTADWLTGDDLVLGYVADDGTTWAHPHRVLNFHEIVNTEIAGRPIVVTYCPLCGSGVIFDRRPDDLRHDGVLTFDNSSAIYENDMVMVDPETHTYWWQVAGQGLVGNLAGTRLTALPSMTTTWASWLELHPETQVLSNDQGFPNRYLSDPFADYALSVSAGSVPFPVGPAAFEDERLSPSTRVIGIDPTGEPAAVAVLANKPTVVAIADRGLVVLLDGRGGGNVYRSEVGGQVTSFVAADDGFVDELTGSKWNAAGHATAGPAVGQRLGAIPSTTAYWFAWVASTQPLETVLYPAA